MQNVKDQAVDLISRLPADVTWQEIIYGLNLKRKIEEGIKAADEGRVLSHDEVKGLFLRSE